MARSTLVRAGNSVLTRESNGKTSDKDANARFMASILEVALESSLAVDLFSTLKITSKFDAEVTLNAAIELVEKSVNDPSLVYLDGALNFMFKLAEPKDFITVCKAIYPLLGNSENVERLKNAFNKVRDEVNPELAGKIDLFIKNPGLFAQQVRSEELNKGIKSSFVDRMNAIPLLKEIFLNLRSSPQSFNTYLAIGQRRTEFAKTPDGSYRSDEPTYPATRKITAALTALLRDPSTRQLVRLSIEEYAEQFKSDTWKKLNAGKRYFTDELIIGSGPTSANYRATRAALSPEANILAIEDRDIPGGQFAATDVPVFALNSRTRPEGRLTRASLPGTDSPLNTLGPYVPLQQADISGALYGSQSDFGAVIALNQILAGDVLCGTRVLKILPADPKTDNALYKVTIENNATGEKAFVYTNKVISARGLGESTPAVNLEDKTTKAVYESEKALGDQSRYLSAADFAKMLGNSATPFPLKNINRITFIGDGDSAKALIEAVLGLGQDIGLSTATLDRVETIYWFGQKSQTKEAFEKCTRDRYAKLALEFPRAANKKAPHRIEPISERVATLSKDSSGKLVIKGSSGKEVSSDLVIDCTGYKFSDIRELLIKDIIKKSLKSAGKPPDSFAKYGANRTPNAFSPTQPAYRGDILVLRVGSEKVVLQIKGITEDYESYDIYTKLKYKVISKNNKIGGITIPAEFSSKVNYRSLTGVILGLEQSLIRRGLNTQAGAGLLFGYHNISKSKLDAMLEAEETSQKGPRSPQLETITGIVNGEVLALAKKVSGEEIYVIGPESQVPLSTKEKKASGVNLINPNLVAVFLYSPRVTTFGEQASAADIDKLLSDEGRTVAIRSKKPVFKVSATTAGSINLFNILEPESRIPQLPYSIDAQRTFLLYAQNLFRGLLFNCPDNKSIDLQIGFKLEKNSKSGKIEATLSGIEESPEIRKIFKEKLSNTKYFAEVCSAMLAPPYTRRNALNPSIEIRVPVEAYDTSTYLSRTSAKKSKFKIDPANTTVRVRVKWEMASLIR